MMEIAKGVESEIRVIFATEALGMGADIRDIRWSIQWCIPPGEHCVAINWTGSFKAIYLQQCKSQKIMFSRCKGFG